MGSRARMAAAACLVASGLLTGGVGAATAFADPGQSTGDETSSRTSDPSGRESDTSSGTRRHDAGTPRNGSGPVREKRADGADRDLPDREDREEREAPIGEEGQDRESPESDPAVPADDGLDVVAHEGRQAEDRKLWPPCCENPEQDRDCPPWWPWPDPDTDEPPRSDSGGGGRPEAELPAGLPFTIPPRAVSPEFSPPAGEPIDPDVVDTVPVGGVPESGPPGVPVSVPVLVPTPSGAGARPGPGTGGAGSPRSNGPRQGTAEPPPARQPPPATAGSNVAGGASSYRVGYGEYLRAAGLSQIAVLAVPGLAGILVLTGAGGLLGYRQAKAGHAVRTRDIARYMN